MLFTEVVYHTQETVLKTRNATQSAPLSSPSCVSSKDHLLTAHESLREENRALLCRDTLSPLHLRLSSISHDSSFQALDLMGLTHGAFCVYGAVTSFLSWKIFFFEGLCRCGCCSASLLVLFLQTFQVLILNKISGYNKEMHGSPEMRERKISWIMFTLKELSTKISQYLMFR